ncbi:MAG: hypothetical protein LBV29_01085, partial [Azoarcus sp.]|nr:hypothetical protein [Azoarcus sp.]
MDNNVFQTVEYSRDQWRMKKVPQALLFFLVGMAFVIYVDPQPLRSGILIAFVVMVAITFVYGLGAILLELIFEGRTTAIRVLATAIAIVFLVAIYWNRPGDLLSPRYPMGPNVETYVLGWMMIIGAGGWITFALYRHFKPPRPILMLSPAGVSYHVSGLKDLLIPWEHVQGVDGLEIRGDAGPP